MPMVADSEHRFRRLYEANWRALLGYCIRRTDSAEAAAWPDASATAQLVTAAMARLEDEDRELLRLTNWEGLSPTEIAIAAGIPAPTVRTRLHRARSRLRRELAQLGWVGERIESTGHRETDERPLVVAPEHKP